MWQRAGYDGVSATSCRRGRPGDGDIEVVRGDLEKVDLAYCLWGCALRRNAAGSIHGGDLMAGCLDGLPPGRREDLARVNGPGLTALREYLASGEAVAFLGAGVSAPLYPLWDGLIGELVDAAAPRLTDKEAATCRALARESPESVVEVVRRGLGPGMYREVLRQVLRVRTDPESGRSWTPVQELVCRCAFKAVVTTNYDPGIVNARMRVRPGASATGFTTWEDELGLDRWRTRDVFGEDELPVLFAHGQHNKPDSVVLATTEYRRAYAGKLPEVLARLMDGHLVWLGFSFADQRIAAVLREIANRAGTRIDPGGAPRHVAVMVWDPDAEGNDPGVLAQRTEIEYGAQLVPRCRCSPGQWRPKRCWRWPPIRRSGPGWPVGARPWCRPRRLADWAGWSPGTRTGRSRPIPWSGTGSGAWSWMPPAPRPTPRWLACRPGW
jgi:hypothetical protein